MKAPRAFSSPQWPEMNWFALLVAWKGFPIRKSETSCYIIPVTTADKFTSLFLLLYFLICSLFIPNHRGTVYKYLWMFFLAYLVSRNSGRHKISLSTQKHTKKMLQQEHWAWGRHTKDILISLIFASSCPLSSILIISQHSLSEDVSNPKMHLEERGENYSKSEGVSFEVFSALGT